MFVLLFVIVAFFSSGRRKDTHTKEINRLSVQEGERDCRLSLVAEM